ncbi:ABC transporter ATP-binding protein [bacterium NHP-B]|nr:ABC transporter ATP-binding protein [bacterium NHP-B]
MPANRPLFLRKGFSLPAFLWQMIKPFRFWSLSMGLVSIVWAIDFSVRPYLLKVMLDQIQSLPPQQAYAHLLKPAAFYIFLTFLIGCMFRWYDFAWIHLNAPLKRHAGLLLMQRMMRHAHPFYQTHLSGNQANKIQDVMSGIPDLLKMLSDQFLAQFLALLIAITTLWTVNVRFAIALSLWCVVYVGATLISAPKAQHLSRKYSEKRASVLGSIVDLLTNMVSVRFFTGEHKEKQILKKKLSSLVNAAQGRDWFFFWIFFFQGMSFVAYQSACILWLLNGFHQGGVSAGDFALILTINITIVDRLWSLSKDFSKFTELLGSVTQGLALVYTPIEIKDKPGAQPLVVKAGRISFQNVQFQYRGEEPLFQNNSVTLQAGQKIGLVGRSGSGKTTFVNLILRLFEIKSGVIAIDGQNIQDVTQESLRNQIAIIPQSPILFHRSIAENIRYGRHDATNKEVLEASKKALSHTFIKKMPEQYDTMVGERGLRLSGGQRQRIAIARAFLKDAPILILDEATSELDSLTESNIQQSLETLMAGKTTLVIAHRLSTLMSMDRILVFDDGNIVAEGTHKSLLRKSPLYKELWSKQVGDFLTGS